MYNKDSIITYRGFKGTIKDFSLKFNVPYNLLYNRLVVLKWDISSALFTPVNYTSNYGSNITYTCPDGVNRTLPQIADKYFITYGTLNNRINKIKKEKDEINFDDIYKEIKIIESNRERRKASRTNQRKIEFISRNKNIENKNDPIYIKCKESKRDYNIVSKRIKQGFTFEEAIEIPLDIVQTKDLVYRNEIGTLRYFCRKYKKNFNLVYNKLKESYDFDYVMRIKETDL